MFASSFESWCVMVDYLMRLRTGRPLADAPYTERVLLIWWRFDVPPGVVADVIAHKIAGAPRYTFSRFYTDDRALRVQESMIGRVRV